MASLAFSYIFFSFHLYIIYAHLSESSENIATPLKFMDEFHGVQKGNHQEGVNKLKKHLAYLGYMTKSPKNFINHENENAVDKCLELALKRYQRFYRLNASGVLDSATISKMRQPQRVMPDFYPTKKKTTAFHERYEFITGRPIYNKIKITYGLKDVDKEFIPPIERALRTWESATHFKFIRAKFYSLADIRISFKPRVHNDDIPFIGDDADDLAHTLWDGRTHFNAAMNWSPNGAADAFDIESVALHELGHALGLDHSDVEEACMSYGIYPGERKRYLHQDDIDGIKALYGI